MKSSTSLIILFVNSLIRPPLKLVTFTEKLQTLLDGLVFRMSASPSNWMIILTDLVWNPIVGG